MTRRDDVLITISLIKDKNLKPTDRLMLIRLVSQLESVDCWSVSLDKMTKQLNVARTTIQRSLKRLISSGYLTESYTRPPGKTRLLSINYVKLETMVSESSEPNIEASRRVLSLYQIWLDFSGGRSIDLSADLIDVLNKKTALLVLAALTIQADSFQAVRGVSTGDLSKLTGASIEYINQTRRLLVRRRLIYVLPGWHKRGIMDRPASTYILRECKPLTLTIPTYTPVINAKFIEGALSPVGIANLFNLKRPEQRLPPKLPNIDKTRNLKAFNQVRTIATNSAEVALFLYLKSHGINFTWISIPQKLDAFYREYAELINHVFKSLDGLDKQSPRLLESISQAYTETLACLKPKLLEPLHFDERSYLRSFAILVCEILLEIGWNHFQLELKTIRSLREVRLIHFPLTSPRFKLLAIPTQL